MQTDDQESKLPGWALSLPTISEGLNRHWREPVRDQKSDRAEEDRFRSLCGRECSHDDPLEGGVAACFAQDQLSQLLGAEGNQRIMTQRCSTCHSLPSRSAFARQDAGLLNHSPCDT